MNKKFSKLLGLLLALALVFTAIPTSFADPAAPVVPAKPAVGGLGGGTVTKEQVDVKFDVTANGLAKFDFTNAAVDVKAGWYLKATDPSTGNTLISDIADVNANEVKIDVDALTKAQMGVANKTKTERDLASLKDVKLVLVLRKESRINNPNIEVATGHGAVSTDDIFYSEEFALVYGKDGSLVKVGKDDKAPFEATLKKDLELKYKVADGESLTVTLLDDAKSRKGVDGKEIYLYPVKIDSEGYYVANSAEHADYQIDEGTEAAPINGVQAGNNLLAGTTEGKTKTNGVGKFEIGKADLETAFGNAIIKYRNSSAEAPVLAVVAKEGNKIISTIGYVSVAKEGKLSLHGVELFLNKVANSTTIKVLVRELYGPKPIQAGKGYKVIWQENHGKVLGEPKWVDTKITATTNEQGYAELVIPNDQIAKFHEIMKLPDNDGVSDVDEYKVFGGLKVVSPKKDGGEQFAKYADLKVKDGEGSKIFDFVIQGAYKFARIEGKDRYETAVQVAQRIFPEGPESGVAILAESNHGADALAASGLAHTLQAPILLAERGNKTLNESTLAYFKELIKAKKLKYVVVLGGEHAVSGYVTEYLQGVLKLGVTTITGEDRFETAAKIAELIHEQGKIWPSLLADMKKHGVDETQFKQAEGNKLLIANGLRFADSVLASMPAAQYGMPILLTYKDTVPAATKDTIEDLAKQKGIFEGWIIGGEAVVAPSIRSQINGANVYRLAGENRYLTNITVNDKFFMRPTKLFIATGNALPDALVSGMLVAKENAGLMIVGPNGLTKEQIAYLKDSTSYSQVEILGGFNAVPARVEDQIMEIMSTR